MLSLWLALAFAGFAQQGEEGNVSDKQGPQHRSNRHIHTYRILDSGWDEKGWAIFQNASSYYSERIYGDQGRGKTLEEVKFMGLVDPVKVLKAFDVRVWQKETAEWRNAAHGGFEIWTYMIIAHYVNKNTVYIDFGTHIGLTILFGAQLAKQTFGIEGDPRAFAECSYNVKLNSNREWTQRIVLQPGMVTATNTRLEMQSYNPGNSCSRTPRDGQAADASCSLNTSHPQSLPLYKWKVRGHRMQDLLENWGVPPNKNVVMKIDIEGYEFILIPSWLEWLTKLKTKPTLWLTLHGASRLRAQEMVPVIWLYKWVYCYKDRRGVTSQGGYDFKKGQTLETLKQNHMACGSFILSDAAPPPMDIDDALMAEPPTHPPKRN